MIRIPAGSTVDILAPAKVNLFLEVLGRRADGYHDLESIFQAVSIFDRIRVTSTPGDRIALRCSRPEIETDDNLAVRAARAFMEEAGEGFGVEIVLEKHIPVQAGLGGGSSDAASVLVALNSMAGRPFSPERLRAIGARMGSDVPFFIEGGTALVTGRGERVRHIDIPGKLYFVVLTPPFGVSTAAVYKNLRLKLTGKIRNVKVLWDLLSTGELAASTGLLFNRLEETAFALEGRLEKACRLMRNAAGGAGVLLAGSGASLFSAFAERDKAAEVFAAIEAVMPQPGELFFAESVQRRTPEVEGKGVNGGDL